MINFTMDPPKVGFAATGLGTNDYWNDYYMPYATAGALTNLQYADGAISGAGLTVLNGPGSWHNGATDPMFYDYNYNLGGNITLTVTNLQVGSYDIYVYGHGPIDQAQSVFSVTAGSVSYGINSTVQGPGWDSTVWREGMQYVVFRGVQITNSSQALTVVVYPGGTGYSIISGMQIAPASPIPPPASGSSLIDIDLINYLQDPLKVGFAATGVSTNDYWNDYYMPGATTGVLTNLRFNDGTSSSADLTVLNGPGFWHNGASDPMFYDYDYNLGGNITLASTNLQVGTYDVYVYGHGPIDAAQSVFSLSAGSVSYGTKSTVQGPGWNSTVWQEGMQYVVFRGVQITNSAQALTVVVYPGSTGYSIISGIQIALAAGPAIPPPILSLLDIDMVNYVQNPVKVGFAATGLTTNDFWNDYYMPSGITVGALTNLQYADGKASGASLTVLNGPGFWSNGAADPMFHDYEYNQGGNITLTVSNLQVGTFDIYVYGHGPIDAAQSIFSLSAGSVSYGTNSTVQGPGWNSTVWQEGMQYVVFRGVQITNSGQALTVFVYPGSTGYSIISGVQIALRAPPVLRLDSGGGMLKLSWPAWAVGFGIEASADLTNWTPATGTLVTNGANVTVTAPAGGPRMFYRLQHP